MLRPLAILALLAFALPAFAQSSPVSLWLAAGRLSTDTFIDGSGERTAFEGSYDATYLHLGGAYALLRGPALTGSVGATLRFLDQSLPAFESGMQVQNLALYGLVENEHLDARLGVVLDLDGQRTDEIGTFFVSDHQHAALLGLGAERRLGQARAFGGFDGFLTFATDDFIVVTDAKGQEVEGARFDSGDVYSLFGGAGYAVGAAEAGLRLQYTYATNAVLDLEDAALYAELGIPDDGTLDDTDRYQFSLIPYVTLRPTALPLTVTLSAESYTNGLIQEYAPVGIVVSGKRTYAPSIPLSLTLRYGF